MQYSPRVYLHSGGGYLEDGIELGNLFRRMQIKTVIPPEGGECYSSCAAAFLGGKYRAMGSGSKILFHAPYTHRFVGHINCLESHSILKSYMVRMLAVNSGEYLYKRTMDFCSSSSGWSLNPEAAEMFDLINAKF